MPKIIKLLPQETCQIWEQFFLPQIPTMSKLDKFNMKIGVFGLYELKSEVHLGSKCTEKGDPKSNTKKNSEK